MVSRVRALLILKRDSRYLMSLQLSEELECIICMMHVARCMKKILEILGKDICLEDFDI